MNLPIDISTGTLVVLVIVAIPIALVFFKLLKWGIKIIISLVLILVIVGFFLYLLT